MLLNAHHGAITTHQETFPTTLTPPPEDSYKINVDAVGPIQNTWGFGTIISAIKGVVLVAAT